MIVWGVAGHVHGLMIALTAGKDLALAFQGVTKGIWIWSGLFAKFWLGSVDAGADREEGK